MLCLRGILAIGRATRAVRSEEKKLIARIALGIKCIFKCVWGVMIGPRRNRKFLRR